MKVWSVANQKGGVGKTTTAVACAGILAERGARVLLVDLDPQGSLTAYFRYNPDTLRRSSYDLFGDFPPRYPSQLMELILPTSCDPLRLLPASTGLATVEREAKQRDGIGLRLRKVLGLLAGRFDYVLVDTPPVLGVMLVNALAAGDRLLLPVQTDYLAVKGLERMLQTLKMVTRARPRELSFSVVPTLFDPTSASAVASLRNLRASFAAQVCQAVVPLDNNLRDASAEGVVPSRYAPYGRAVKAYRSLVDELGGGVGAPPMSTPVAGTR